MHVRTTIYIMAPVRTQARALSSASTLANLLPTGTVLAFQALAPSFSNSGACGLTNTLLTAALIAACSLACFLSSFTDSFVAADGKLYYGVATPRGFYVFNPPDEDAVSGEEGVDAVVSEDLGKYRIRCIDFVHAFVSLLVFLVFAVGDHDVVACFFSRARGDGGGNQLVVNLPLGVGMLASFLFVIFPTTRRGIGYGDMTNGSR